MNALQLLIEALALGFPFAGGLGRGFTLDGSLGRGFTLDGSLGRGFTLDGSLDRACTFVCGIRRRFGRSLGFGGVLWILGKYVLVELAMFVVFESVWLVGRNHGFFFLVLFEYFFLQVFLLLLTILFALPQALIVEVGVALHHSVASSGFACGLCLKPLVCTFTHLNFMLIC